MIVINYFTVDDVPEQKAEDEEEQKAEDEEEQFMEPDPEQKAEDEEEQKDEEAGCGERYGPGLPYEAFLTGKCE